MDRDDRPEGEDIELIDPLDRRPLCATAGVKPYNDDTDD